MARSDRLAFIENLEKSRGSRVVAIFMGDRPGLETRIATDLIPLLARHLRAMGKVPKVDLYLYSLGGEVMVGYRTVSLIREYCDHFAVLVPFKCQSTGTLIALGADEIVMLAEGQLSPVDPSITGPYNPLLPGVQIQPGTPLPVLPVSVEEVVSYVHLAKEVGGVQGEAGLISVFERLTADVRPMALGQVYRARTQIRMLSRKLLQSHMPAEDPKIEEIVATLNEKLYSHDYLISRREAKSIGLNVIDPSIEVEESMVRLFDQYSTDLELFLRYNPMATFQGQQGPGTANISNERAYVETTGRLDTFITERTMLMVGPNQFGEQINFEGWRSS